jgi:succinate dehydrogenase/fumarate reductase flavoprotein subunit
MAVLFESDKMTDGVIIGVGLAGIVAALSGAAEVRRLSYSELKEC